MVWLRMERAPPPPPEVGKEGVERPTNRTVEARAMTLVGRADWVSEGEVGEGGGSGASGC
jgi:hypothetical protein